VIQEIAQPTVNPGNIQMQGSAVILGNKLFGYRIMEFVCCSNTVWRFVFGNIIKICLKWRRIHQLIIRMPNWFWFPKNVTAHFPEYDFHQRNGIQQPWNWSRIVHTNSHVTQNTRWIFYSSNYWKPFWFNLFYFLKKSHTTQPRISWWESSELL
jgi:hypothetical protein